MKSRTMVAFFMLMLTVAGPALAADSCQDEQSMAQGVLKSAADIVDTVKKESQADFEGKFHQKNTLNKLTFAISALGDEIECLDKASQGGDQAAGAKKDAESKLKDRLTQYRDSLKSTEAPKSAKSMIATFDLSST